MESILWRSRRAKLLFYDLHRIAVPNLRRAGVAESVIMKITGYPTRGIFDRYNITNQANVTKSGQAVEKKKK